MKVFKMLVVIYGPSCAGKTTIIKKLCNNYEFKPIMAYTTRKSRPIDYEYDFARATISKEKFEAMSKNNEFSFVNHHFNNFYGTSRIDIEDALSNSSAIYVTDYSIGKRHDFEDLASHKFVIKPKTEFDLLQWIQGSNRHERINDILSDYRNNYGEELLKNLESKGYQVIVNQFGILDEIVDLINKKVKSLNGSLHRH